MNTDFNESFNEGSEKAEFIYKPNELVPRSFRIFQYKQDKEDYEPVGEYTLLDIGENPEITEKKMVNLISIMNGKKRLVDLSNLTKTRILYNMIPVTPETDRQKVIFRTYDGKGVSTENAVLTIEKGVFPDDDEALT